MKSQEAWDFAQKYCVADDLCLSAVPVGQSFVDGSEWMDIFWD